MDKPKPVTVTVLKHHTWRGTDYEPGQTYEVEGDASQSTDQYLETLKATGFAVREEDKGTMPNIVNEVGDPSTAVQPLTTENFAQEAKPAEAPAAKPAKPAAKPAAAKVAKAAKAKPAKAGGKKK